MSSPIRTLAGLALSGVLLVGVTSGTPSITGAGCPCTVSWVSDTEGTVSAIDVSGRQAVEVSVQSNSSASHVAVGTDVTAGNVAVDGVEAELSQRVVRTGDSRDDHVIRQESSVEVVQSGDGQESSVEVVQQHVSQSATSRDDGASGSRSTRSDGCLAWSLWRLGLGVAGLFGCP